MKKIEIITAHNVVIQYEIAPLIQRILAFFLDLLVLLAYFTFISYLMSAFTDGRYSLFDDSDSMYKYIQILLMLPIFFYSFLLESFFSGQSVGKLVLGIRVVNVNGDTPSLGDLFLRWMFRMLEIMMSFGTIAVLAILVNEKKQRLGGLVSNTLVIRLKPTKPYSINNILSLKNIENYEPTYPTVVQFTDDDVLLIKNALERQKKFNNKAHNQILLTLSKKATEKLKLAEEPKNKIEFLKALVQDYVVLTRS